MFLYMVFLKRGRKKKFSYLSMALSLSLSCLVPSHPPIAERFISIQPNSSSEETLRDSERLFLTIYHVSKGNPPICSRRLITNSSHISHFRLFHRKPTRLVFSLGWRLYVPRMSLPGKPPTLFSLTLFFQQEFPSFPEPPLTLFIHFLRIRRVSPLGDISRKITKICIKAIFFSVDCISSTDYCRWWWCLPRRPILLFESILENIFIWIHSWEFASIVRFDRISASQFFSYCECSTPAEQYAGYSSQIEFGIVHEYPVTGPYCTIPVFLFAFSPASFQSGTFSYGRRRSSTSNPRSTHHRRSNMSGGHDAPSLPHVSTVFFSTIVLWISLNYLLAKLAVWEVANKPQEKYPFQLRMTSSAYKRPLISGSLASSPGPFVSQLSFPLIARLSVEEDLHPFL